MLGIDHQRHREKDGPNATTILAKVCEASVLIILDTRSQAMYSQSEHPTWKQGSIVCEYIGGRRPRPMLYAINLRCLSVLVKWPLPI